MDTRPKDLPTIIGEAIEIATPAEREAYLERVCGGDADQRRRVDQLLDDHARAGDFLEQPAMLATLIVPPISEGPGMMIGPYKLLEQIGEGGFGVVFMAEQAQPVRRKVALKVIKPGMDTRQVIARFEAERQALALMEHPNIARVLDVGTTESGRPYFVMELVKGIPITEFCDQCRLPTRERLELFVDVCHAVQHAHQKAIIHRDIKPSNVLVTQQDGKPLVKVIDFGIAKATGQQLTDKTLFTGFGQLIGTPLYMSPEQAALSAVDVDTRSDVYSLGVLLYELLTNTTPFSKETLSNVSYDELRRVICEDEPPRPSTRLSTLQANALSTICDRRKVDPRKLNHEVRGELDWIVMKALEKDRQRRYESASAFAGDVGRYLKNEAVEACPPSAAYRLRKFARRNRRLLVSAGVIGLALLATTMVSTWQALRARDAQHQAEADRERAEDAEQQAAAISNFLERDLLLQVDNDLQRGDGFTADPNLTVLEALQRAAARIGDHFHDQPLVEAAIRLTIGRAYRSVGDERRAVVHLERTVELRKAHLRPDHPDTLNGLWNLAMAYQFLDRLPESISLLEHILEQRRATLGPEHELTIKTLNSLGEACRKAGLLDRAAQLIEQALKKKKATLGLDHPSTANSMHDLGLVYRDSGRYLDAIAMLEQATKKLEVLCGTEHSDTLYSMGNLAETYEKAGELDQADLVLRDIITRTGKENVRLSEHLADRRMHLGQRLLKQEKFPEAESLLRDCLTIRELKQPDDWKTFNTKSMLGASLSGQKNYAAAEPLLLAGYEGMKKREFTIPAEGKFRLTEGLERLVQLYDAWNQKDKANEWRKRIEETKDAKQAIDRN